jgi:hypothetical protein
MRIKSLVYQKGCINGGKKSIWGLRDLENVVQWRGIDYSIRDVFCSRCIYM